MVNRIYLLFAGLLFVFGLLISIFDSLIPLYEASGTVFFVLSYIIYFYAYPEGKRLSRRAYFIFLFFFTTALAIYALELFAHIHVWLELSNPVLNLAVSLGVFAGLRKLLLLKNEAPQ